MILLDELYAAQDDGFVDTLRGFHSSKKLESFVEKWKKAPGDWPREQVREYFDQPLNAPGHEVVVKRLFKHYEELGDDEVVAWCMVAFDRLVRRVRKRVWRYDWQTRQQWHDETLVAPSNQTRVETDASTQKVRNPFTGRMYDAYVPPVRNRKGHRLFSYPTRHYLRRRAWRYFRRLGYMQPERYVKGVAHALMLYVDDDFSAGENIIDSWSMVHACYGKHEAVEFSAAYCKIKSGYTLGDLAPAPYHLHLWQQTESFDVLMDLLAGARSSLIRLWAMEMIKAHHAQLIASLTPERLIPLFEHRDSRVQSFAAEAFGQIDGLGTLRIETWLKLLEGSSVSALTLICEAMAKHVTPDRLNNMQMIQLAGARPVPVARMGLGLVQQRHTDRPFLKEELAGLAETQCEAIAGEAAQWVLGMHREESAYDIEVVSAFFDSPRRLAREASLEWLDASSPGWNDPRLWARLIETPYEDLRLGVIQKLEDRKKLPGSDTDALAPVWVSVVLGVNRGGRRKPDAIRQVTRAILESPERAESLVPILALAVRSIRGPEQRVGLSAVAELAEANEQLRSAIEQALPELGLPAAAVGGGA